MSKFFNNPPMCVICKKRHRDNVIDNGSLCICKDCHLKLPITKLSFSALHSAAYIISPLYYKGDIVDSIIDYKFHSCREYSKIFAEFMIKSIKGLEHLKNFDLMLPIPISKRRLNERGYNQSSLIAEPLAKDLGIIFNDTLIFRNRHTKKQSILNDFERATNIKGAFSLTGDVSGKKIILFDDIYTTGYTLCEAAKLLIENGAEQVVGLTLAIAHIERHGLNTGLIF